MRTGVIAAQQQHNPNRAVATGYPEFISDSYAAAFFFPLPNIRTTQSVTGGGVAMKSMDKISTGIAYGTSAGSAGYWFLQWLDQVSPSQWAAIGVLGSLVLGFLTYLTNLYFKIREDRRKAARGE